MSDANQKGTALEKAVLAIERAILKASPLLSENAFKIEARHVLTVADVRHEVDIWVEVNIGPGYSSVFLFECKNWSEKVGKNWSPELLDEFPHGFRPIGELPQARHVSLALCQRRSDPLPMDIQSHISGSLRHGRLLLCGSAFVSSPRPP